MNWQTIKYDGHLDFSSFECDEPILNTFLHSRAKDEHDLGLCVLYFLVCDTDNIIGGYYVMSNGSISRDEQLPTAKARKNLKYNKLGTVHIGRLARHKDLLGLQLGKHLIFSALATAVESSKVSGVWAITVDAKNSRAEAYYSQFGFELLKQPNSSQDYPKSMYLKIKDAKLIINPS